MGRSGTNSLWSSDKLFGIRRCSAACPVCGALPKLCRLFNETGLEEFIAFRYRDEFGGAEPAQVSQRHTVDRRHLRGVRAHRRTVQRPEDNRRDDIAGTRRVIIEPPENALACEFEADLLPRFA